MKTLAKHILEGFSNENNENLIDDVVGDLTDKKRKGIAEEVSEEEKQVDENASEKNEDLEKEKPTE